MALIDLKTDLKSLKYGLDRRGMGSSKEPFITKDIPEGDTPGARQDFLLRQGALVSSENDTSRLTQLFTTTRGLGFITNQNLLSKNSVKTEATLGPSYLGGTLNQGVYLPTSTLAQSLVGVTGTHLNLLGLDPSSPMSGIVEGGLFPGGGLIRYEQVASEYNQAGLNRLVSLYDTKIAETTILPTNPLVSSDPNFILEYSGGPNSVLGVGKTKTKRTTTTKTLKTAYKKLNGVDDLKYTTTGQDIDGNLTTVKTYDANPNFTKYRYGNISSEGNYAEDKFNKLNTANLNNNLLGSAAPDDQLFKFYMQFISPPSTISTGSQDLNSKYLYWQAYVDNFSDQIGASYDSYDYVGRGYPLYKYSGFSRKIGLDFTIVANSSEQIKPIYQKLNNLIQFMAPNYSSGGHMRGNFVKLTFGDYLNNVPGIVEGFSLSPIFDAGFDITNGQQLAKAIKVSGFQFTPIADNKNSIMSKDSTFISI